VPDQAAASAAAAAEGGGGVRPRDAALRAGARQEAPLPPDAAAPGAVGAGLAQTPFEIRAAQGVAPPVQGQQQPPPPSSSSLDPRRLFLWQRLCVRACVDFTTSMRMR
jgi:hypothetical protein